MEGRVSVDKDATMTWPMNEEDVWAPALVVDMCLGAERAKRVEIALPPWVGWFDGIEGAPPCRDSTQAVPGAIPSAIPV